jgi:choline dehydrogenase-like flavoprotein
VADASLFPTALGVNPMVTICAVSRRIAAGLAERLS